jgi:hypothetical protein
MFGVEEIEEHPESEWEGVRVGVDINGIFNKI